MKLVASPHTHVESPMSGSTMESMVEQAVLLGRTHFSYTDPAYLTSAYRTYQHAIAKGLKYIPGIEVYFKDSNCDIIRGTRSERVKYYKLTLHALDQEGYQRICWLSSKERSTFVSSYGSEFPLWCWSDLEDCRGYNIAVCSSDVHDIVTKHLLIKRPDLSVKVLEKLKNIFGDKLYLSIIGNRADRAYESFVHLKFVDGTDKVIFAKDKVRTGAYKMGVPAQEIPNNFQRHQHVLAYVSGGAYHPVDKDLQFAKVISGFVKLPNGDPQMLANKLVVALGDRYGIPVLYSDYACYATQKDKPVQDVRLSSENIKEFSVRHMQSGEEAVDYMVRYLGLSEQKAYQVLNNNAKWASMFNNFSLKYEYSIPELPENRDPIAIAMDIIKINGRMRWGDPTYVDRLATEIKVLAKNGKINLIPYFFPIRDVLNHYAQNDLLTGPARGSAAGSLFMYLMGITQVDPIKYDTSFERFLSLDRVLAGNWPDVDIDLVSRDHLVGIDGRSGYLYGRWGNKAAQISTRTNMRLKSAIKDVNRYLKGEVEPDIEKLSKSLPPPPQGVSDHDFVFGYEEEGIHQEGLIEINDDLKKYALERPVEWDLVKRCLGIARQHSKHASAFVIADKPIAEIVPMFMGNVTQYEAKGVEKAKLIKYDFLVVKQLEDIQKCIKLINKKSGNPLKATHFCHNNVLTYIWDLPEDLDVYASIWEGSTESLFQINTRSMVPFVKDIKPSSIFDLSDILALVRPGPLDYVDEKTGRTMAEEYIYRKKGLSLPDIPKLAEILPKTCGVMIYQEDLTKIARILGEMRPDDAENLRRVMSKKLKVEMVKMKPLFMQGAIKNLGEETAEKIWDMMATFARYGFNRAHSISYAMITYACMYLRYYYPSEWWASVLSNASESEISNELYKYVHDRLAPPDINSSGSDMTIDYDTGKIRSKISVLKGIGESAAEAIVSQRPYTDIKDFVKKKVAGSSLTKKLIVAGVMDSLFAPNTTLSEKMLELEIATKEAEYEKKLAAGIKAKPIDKSKILPDEEWLGMHPLKEYCIKKSVFPTLPYSLYNIVVNHFMLNIGTENKPLVSCTKGRPVRLYKGEHLQKIEQITLKDRDVFFASTGYVLKAEEFSYAKGSKKALKMVVDSDGYITERVIWPDYDTGKLKYPKNLKKGTACLLFLQRRVGKDQTKIYDIKVLDESKS